MAAQAGAASVTRTPYAAAEKGHGASKAVKVDTFVFPSAAVGTTGDAMAQVDEAVRKMDATLKAQGLSGIGAMMQHTVYLKDGAAMPIEVLTRFHAEATRLAPSLKDKSSVGTIVRVPRFPDDKTLVMLDVVAGGPAKGKPDSFERVPFTFGPKEISETIGDNEIVFTSGLEAMDFEHGSLVPTIDEQIVVIVGKLHAALEKKGLDVGNMISHNLYVTKGTDPIRVITKFHEEARKYSPSLKDSPSVGTLVVVDGMAVPGFLLEMDAVAVKGDPTKLKRVPFTEMPMDIAKTVNTEKLVWVAGMEGVDFEAGGKVDPDVNAQVDAAVKKIDAALKAAGSSVDQIVKAKLYVTADAGDAEAVRAHFNAALAKIAPGLKAKPPAETLVIVEGLAGPGMKFETSVIAARK
jgi:enamine deaminase RidA (YjgF/YER057c/UK114 family)